MTTPATETTPAVRLRGNIVLIVVIAIVALTFLLYGVIGLLLAYGRSVPGEMWLAAGTFGGHLAALLVNTKHDASKADPAPVKVVNAPGDPVPVDTGPDVPPDDDGVAEGPESPPAPRQRRR